MAQQELEKAAWVPQAFKPPAPGAQARGSVSEPQIHPGGGPRPRRTAQRHPMLQRMGDTWGPPPCPTASRPSRCRGVAQGPCASCGSCTGPCCSSRGLRVPRWGCLLRRGLGELVGEGRKSGSALACLGGVPLLLRRGEEGALGCAELPGHVPEMGASLLQQQVVAKPSVGAKRGR